MDQSICVFEACINIWLEEIWKLVHCSCAASERLRYDALFCHFGTNSNQAGAALSPAITRLASLQNIKVPTNGAAIYGVVDVDDLVTWGSDLVLPLRDKLSTGQPSDYVPRMWQHVMPNCSRTSRSQGLGSDYHAGPCDVGGLTFETLAEAPEAWVCHTVKDGAKMANGQQISQLPGGFNTGVKTLQVVPRINSSVSVDRIDVLPEVCKGGNGASVSLLINHAGQAWEYSDYDAKEVKVADWWVRICIPTDSTSTSAPFASTNGMQTIQETAYIETYSMLLIMDRYHATHRVTINTTIGNFQLPNYILKNRPGPLLSHWSPPSSPYVHRAVDSFPSQRNMTANIIDDTHTPGPLLAIIYALFGDGSLPAIYSELNATYKMVEEEPTNYNYPCLLSSPLYNLAEPYVPDLGSHSSSCLQPSVIRNGASLYGFLYIFNQSTPVLEKVFRAAAYMYHDILFSEAGRGGSNSVEYDAGADLQKPSLSDGSIIGLTIVIAIFLTCLLSLALYASLTRTWTSSLDAYAMLRIGAELGPDAIPFLAVKDPDVVVELDELPGWVGDVANTEEKTGVLGLGYSKTAHELDRKKKYKAYDRRQRRGKWRMFEYYITGIFGCWGRRNTQAAQKAWNFRKAVSRVYRCITSPIEDVRAANQRYQAQLDGSYRTAPVQ